MKKVYFKTYGCSNNQAESEIMQGLLKQDGYALTDSLEESDIVVVNTCSVKSKTEHKTMDELKKLDRMGKKIVVGGCISDADPKLIRKTVPNASMLGTHNIVQISNIVENTLQDKRLEVIGKENKDEKVLLPKVRQNPVIDIIPIESGCNSACTFCSTKLAKGDLNSYQPNKIIEQIKNARQEGCKEFWLTGQDCGCYGFDIGTDMAELINRIVLDVPGKYFIRPGMMNPLHTKKLTQSLIKAYTHSNVFKFLHLPVQSGSDIVLKNMRRGHDSSNYLRIVNEFRSVYPELMLMTDMIVGFPGETEEDFQRSIELLEKSKPDFVNISKYSNRPGTRAFKMKQIPSNVIKERSRIMTDVATKIAVERNEKWKGWKGQIIIDEYKHEKKSWLGRNYAYKAIAIHAEKQAFSLGEVVDVEIIETGKSLIGRII